MKKKNYTSKFLAVTIMVMVMLCAAPVMEHFGIDMGVSAHAAKSGYFTYEVEYGEATITKLDEGKYYYVTIPETIGGYPVTALGENAFEKCYIEEFIIGKNLESISQKTFKNAEILYYEVNSNNPVLSSDSNGCLYNKNKTSFYQYPSGNKQKSFTIPSSVTYISGYAFCNSFYLQEVKMYDSVEEIGEGAFYNCVNLESVKLSNSITAINDYTFCNCLWLSEITVPQKCTVIGDYALYTCLGFSSISLTHVEEIGEGAFEDCFGVKEVTIGYNKMKIGEYAFCMSCYSISNNNDLISFIENYGLYLYADSYGYEEEAKEYNQKANDLLTNYGKYVPYGKIYCYKGSTAETYAKNNGIDYSYISDDSSGHTHSLTEIIIPSTCTEQGGRYVGCTQCDYIASYELYSLAPHTYKTKTTKATTSKNGKVVKACTVCGDVISSKTIFKISSIKLSATSYTYNGKVKTPSVVVKDSKGKTLKKDTDYTVTYSSGRKAVGTYKVKITFKGYYSGTKTLSFKIVLGQVTGIKSARSGNKTTISWNKVTGATGYVVYEYNKNTGKYTKLGTFKINSIKNNYLGRNTALKIRAYYKAKDGTVHYGAYSAKTTIKI